MEDSPQNGRAERQRELESVLSLKSVLFGARPVRPPQPPTHGASGGGAIAAVFYAIASENATAQQISDTCGN